MSDHLQTDSYLHLEAYLSLRSDRDLCSLVYYDTVPLFCIRNRRLSICPDFYIQRAASGVYHSKKGLSGDFGSCLLSGYSGDDHGPVCIYFADVPFLSERISPRDL